MLLRLLRTLLPLCLLLFWATAQTAPIAAGTVISNTASGSYVDSASGLAVRLRSNTVNTTLTVLEAFALTASQNVLVATGNPFAISHALTNTGNAASTYLIGAGVAPGSAFTPLNLQVFQDSNANGRVDPGEPVVGAGGAISLAPGASVSLLITGLAPATSSPGQAAQLVLSAVSQLQGVNASNTDTVTLTSGAAIAVTLGASSAAAVPGQAFSLTATAVNNGSMDAGPAAITLNGAAASLLVLRVPVPANASFAAAQASTSMGAQTLYHLLGSPANGYVSVIPAGAVVDAMAWGVAKLAPGMNLQGQFSVTVNVNAAGTIVNTAYANWTDQGAALVTPSNPVGLPLPVNAASVAFYTSTSYATPSIQNTAGSPLFVQVNAAVCNTSPAQIGTVPVTLVSQLTGDTETFTAMETGPNTGLFRILPNVPTANAAQHIVASGDGILEVLRNDVVTATLSSCGGVSVSALTTLLIDPSGVVYDSRTNQPIGGVTVQLIDVTGGGNGGKAGGPATVFGADAITPVPGEVVTGADGSFAFPFVLPSTYKLVLSTLAGYAFPSKMPVALQPAGRLIDLQGSYGNAFAISGDARGPVHFDVPLDAGLTGGLFIQKTANKATAEVGDFVDYAVKFNNFTAAVLPDTLVNDSLPAGFAYVRGTARLNGVPIADPAGGAGPSLQFSLGRIAVGSQPVLSYRLRVGAGSLGGNGINTAQAASGFVRSNRADARVDVVGGVFSSKAYLFGKVFADCRQNGIQDAGDPGIPGVRIYLEDGTYAVTDEEGKYSLYGLSPRTHVVKLDSTTLPRGATLELLNNRNALDAGSQFVDLANGELHKADFAIAQCTPDIRDQVAARRRALVNPAEILQAATALLSPTAATMVDGRTLPANGTIGLPGAAPVGGAGNAGTAPAAAGLGVVAPSAPSAAALGAVGDVGGPYGPHAQGQAKPLFTPGKALPQALPFVQSPAGPSAAGEAEQALEPLENLLAELGPEVGFINLRNEQVLSSDQTRVRVKGPLGATFELLVNGQAVPVTQVGKKSALQRTATLAWEYIGINLKPGRNILTVSATDPFGNVRGMQQVTVLAPGPLAKIQVVAPQQPIADGATALPIIIRLRDGQDLPVAGPTQVTLLSSLGQWQTPDLDPHQPGTQVFVERGEAVFLLLPPAQPGQAELSASGGTVHAATTLEFLPNLRPMIAAGLIEGTLNLRNLNPSRLQPTQSGDVFEQQIQSASRSLADGKGDVAARAALFLKGKILGSTLLTLAYDSDKPSGTALFRDIQPNQFYPVYGDSSARGFDAQSTGKLYVMVQNGTSYVLLGDYTTQSENNPARQLTQYARALNGVKARLQEGNYTVEGFSSRTATTQLVQEFRANGTSGPFHLATDGVVNSQQVDVLTRDRNQPSVIVKDVPLTAFTDYEIEAYSGRLLLKSPVSSVDANLNPVFIRVSYSVDSGGPEHLVAGADGRVQLTPNLALGATYIRDDDAMNKQRLTGVNLRARLGDKTIVTAEVAGTDSDLKGSGSGQRVEIRHDESQLQARAWGVRTDAGFSNPNSPQSAGQSEYGAKVGYALGDKDRLVAEALKTSNDGTGAEQTGMELKLEHSLPGNAKVEAGVRYSRANTGSAFSLSDISPPAAPSATGLAPAAAQVGTTTVRAKLTLPVPGVPQADVYGLAEYAIDGSGGREIGLGGNYAINPTTKLFVRHDFINSLNGPYTLNPAVSKYTTVAGLNTELPDSTQLFNEYRMGDSLDGRSSEAAVGLRRLWRLTNGLGLTFSAQRIKPLSGVVTDDSSAATLGVDYTAAADWKGSAQVQWQTSASSRSWLLTGAVANKLDAHWTVLNRALYSDQTHLSGTGGARQLSTAQTGFSYRPVETDMWNALGRLQYKHDQDSTLGPGLNRDESSWIVSAHINVQPRRDWQLTGRYAAKLARDRSTNLESRSFTQLLGGRAIWDMTDRLDLGLQAYRLWGNGAAEAAVGIELGYLIWKNLWLSAGYNLKGFNAPDLASEAYTQPGRYLRLRFKFDENLLSASATIPATGPVISKP